MDNFLSLLRAVLIFGGSFLIGHHFYHSTIDMGWWDLVSGILIDIAVGVWSWVDKKLLIEQKISFVRNVVTAGCGVLMAAGVLTDKTHDMIMSLVGAIAMYLTGGLIKSKNQQLNDNTINIRQLKQ